VGRIVRRVTGSSPVVGKTVVMRLPTTCGVAARGGPPCDVRTLWKPGE
jgi:hypothetical protein